MTLCIYCQCNRATTRDHIPPRALFKKPRPSNLITVPACRACNQSFGSDDDYFLNITLDSMASKSSDGTAVAQKRFRSMVRPEGRATWKPVMDTFAPVEIRSTGGVILGQSLSCRIDMNRLVTTATRMIRGLFYDVTQTVLPLDATVVCLSGHAYAKRHSDDPAAMKCIEYLPFLESRSIGDRTFEFRYNLDNELQQSFWHLLFFERLAFIGCTKMPTTEE